MKWLITGGCGFIGTCLGDEVLGQGAEVCLLDNLSRVGSSENLQWLRGRHGSDWMFVRADVRNAASLDTCVREFKPDVIAHLAGQVAMTTSLADPRADFEINAGGTVNVLEAARAQKTPPAILYSSTNKVYGSLENLRYREDESRYSLCDYRQGLNEEIPLDAASPYGCSKLAGDQYVRDYARVFGLQTAVFRHSSMYGGRQFATSDQGWIGWFCEQAIRTRQDQKHRFTIAGNGKQVRDALHSEDLVSLYTKAAANISVVSGNVFNIGGGIDNASSLIELFRRLESKLSVRLDYEKLEPRVSDQKVFVADTTSIEVTLGWSPKVTIDSGLDRALSWTFERLGLRPSNGCVS
jgi:CDP-paratose 2-epimerase